MKFYSNSMPLMRCIEAATIGAIGSIAGSAIGAIGQGNMNRANRKFAKEQAEEQRNWSEKMFQEVNAVNLENWNRENEYNSPINQVQRLRDAGLNPLYYGLDGTGNAGAVETAQPLGYERANVGNQMNPYSNFGDIATKVAQIANIQADTAKKNNENLTETQRREKLIADIEVTKQELFNKIADKELTDAQRQRVIKDLQWCDRLNEATLAEKEAKTKLDNSQQKRIDALLEGEKIMQVKTIEDFEHKWQKISAECAKMAKETGLLQKDIENYALNHASNGFMGTGLSLQNLIRGGKGVSDAISNSSKVQNGQSILAEDNR